MFPTAQNIDTTFPGLRHTFEPVPVFKGANDPKQADVSKEFARMPHQGQYDAAIRGLLGAGMPRPS